MSFKRIILKNTAVGWVTVVISMGTRFVTVPLILNGVGKNQYALYALATSLVNYLYLFDSGISGAVCRLLAPLNKAKNRPELVKLVATSYAFLVSIVLVLTALCVIFPKELIFDFLNIPAAEYAIFKTVFYISFLEFVVVFVSRVDIGILQGKNQFSVMWFIESVVALVSTLFIYVFYKLGNLTLVNVALILSIGRALGAVGLFFASGFVREKVLCFRHYSGEALKPILDIGFSATIVTMVGIMQSSLAPSIYSRYLSIEAVFFCSIATALMLMASRFINTIFSSFTPYISELNPQKDHEGIKRLIVKGLSLASFSHGVACLLSSLFLDTLVRIWLSDKVLKDSDFEVIYYFVNLLLISLYISNAPKMMDITFSSTGKHWKNTYLSVATTVAFCVSLVILAKLNFLYCYPVAMLLSGFVKTGGTFRLAQKVGYLTLSETLRLTLVNFVLPLGLVLVAVYRKLFFSDELTSVGVAALALGVFIVYYLKFPLNWLLVNLGDHLRKRRA